MENTEGYLDERQHLKIETISCSKIRTRSLLKKIVDYLSENGWVKTNTEIFNGYDNQADRRTAS
jgi:hypothetical protein